jgi:hypothetical protein
MQSDAEAHGDKIQRYVEQLYEDERLTDNLADQSAGTLLKWGEAQLKALAGLNLDEAALDGAARQLRSLMRSINNLAGQHMDLSEEELVEGLIDLVKETLQYRDTLSTPPKEPAHGEETRNISDSETQEK